MEKYETQQKVLEAALESLKENEKQRPVLSQEEYIWMRMGRELKPFVCCIRKDLLRELVRTAHHKRLADLFRKLRVSEHHVIFHNQKPLKDCSLKEVMDGIVITCKAVNVFDAITYTDDGNYYTLRVTHSYGGGITHTKLLKIFLDPLFDSYGVKTESELYPNALLMKIFKTQPLLPS